MDNQVVQIIADNGLLITFMDMEPNKADLEEKKRSVFVFHGRLGVRGPSKIESILKKGLKGFTEKMGHSHRMQACGTPPLMLKTQNFRQKLKIKTHYIPKKELSSFLTIKEI
ncbi:hypothetical protein AYI68_g7390 [Smittium mucronatum]|uniref:Uncharacterized protein n=1 Tax=Smittium mucronatum TaxID=133383 RepID=A0A1R0GNW0_9FUNG|nr:hypothetical protein AYI68_g7390 [Smittium mucronatum]